MGRALLAPEGFHAGLHDRARLHGAIKPEFDKRNVKIIGLSVDPVDKHAKWAKDIEETQGYAPNFPMIGDPELKIAKAYGMLPAEIAGSADGRTAADNQTVRNVYVIGPDKKIKLVIFYPDDHGAQLRRGAARHRLAAADRQAQGGDAGELEARRGRDHRRLGLRRGREEELSAGLEVAQALHPHRPATEVRPESGRWAGRARPLRRASRPHVGTPARCFCGLFAAHFRCFTRHARETLPVLLVNNRGAAHMRRTGAVRGGPRPHFLVRRLSFGSSALSQDLSRLGRAWARSWPVYLRTSKERPLTMRINGTVKFFNGAKGFGFITPEDGSKDVFVHATALEAAGIRSLNEGDKVSFTLEDDRKGRGKQAGQIQKA